MLCMLCHAFSLLYIKWNSSSACEETVAFIDQVAGCCGDRNSWKCLGRFWYLQPHLQLPDAEELRLLQGELAQKGCFEMCDSVRALEEALLSTDGRVK